MESKKNELIEKLLNKKFSNVKDLKGGFCQPCENPFCRNPSPPGCEVVIEECQCCECGCENAGCSCG